MVLPVKHVANCKVSRVSYLGLCTCTSQAFDLHKMLYATRVDEIRSNCIETTCRAHTTGDTRLIMTLIASI